MRVTFKLILESPVISGPANDLHLKLFANKMFLDKKLTDKKKKKKTCFQEQ